jgi:hypothetical protein
MLKNLNRDDVKKVAIIVGTRIVLPVVATTLVIAVQKKLDNKTSEN